MAGEKSIGSSRIFLEILRLIKNLLLFCFSALLFFQRSDHTKGYRCKQFLETIGHSEKSSDCHGKDKEL